ncbi:MAG: ABC transporter permease subunit [Oscillospiraceae bacterium]|nr:ABC transporter permease subunit [Oscillospiraceae bacterium]
MTQMQARIMTPNNKKKGLSAVFRYIFVNRYFYALMMPGLIYLIIFRYYPMYGILMAFKDFSFAKGIIASPWNDFANFKQLFQSTVFFDVLRNSVVLSVLRIVWGFPIPIILALLINEIRAMPYKRTTQTLMYLPHFISWVALMGIIHAFLTMEDGIVNMLIFRLTGTKINFLGSPQWFRSLVIITSLWKEAGWGTIVYLASLSAINPEYYEAATVDGANRFQKLRHITVPGIADTIMILFILRVGSVMSNGFEQTFLLQNNLNLDVAEVFETYTYRIGIVGGRYSFSAAVGLFQNVVGAILVFTTNQMARAMGRASFY